MRTADEPSVLGVDGVVGNIQGFAAPQVDVPHVLGLFAMNLLGETDVYAFDKTVGGCVEAVIRQEIVIQFPKNV